MCGSDAVVREDWRGVENTPPKSGSLFALHTNTLSFISIDYSPGFLVIAQVYLLTDELGRKNVSVNKKPYLRFVDR